MASEENIGKLYRIAQLGSNEVIEYENFRASLLKSIDKDLDVDQVMIKMLEVSEGQSLGTYKNGIFIFSEDIMKAAEKLVHEENKRIPGTKEYEMVHQNDNIVVEQEDFSNLPMIDKCKRFSELTMAQRREILDKFTELTLEEKTAITDSLDAELDNLKEAGVPETIIEDEKRENANVAFTVYRTDFYRTFDFEKANEKMIGLKEKAKAVIELYLKKFEDRKNLTEEEYAALLSEFADIVGEESEAIKDALESGEFSDVDEWVDYTVDGIVVKAMKVYDIRFCIDKLKMNDYGHEFSPLEYTKARQDVESISEEIEAYLTSQDMSALGRIQGLSEALNQHKSNKFDVKKFINDRTGASQLKIVSAKDFATFGTIKNNPTLERVLIDVRHLNEDEARRKGFQWSNGTSLDEYQDTLGISFAETSYDNQTTMSSNSRLANFFGSRKKTNIDERVLAQRRESELRRGASAEAVYRSVGSTTIGSDSSNIINTVNGINKNQFNEYRTRAKIPAITDEDIERSQMLFEKVFVGETIEPERVDVLNPRTVTTLEPIEPAIATSVTIAAEEIDVFEEEKRNQDIEETNPQANSQSNLPKEITLGDKIKEGIFNFRKKLVNVAKAIITQDKSKRLLERIADAINDTDTSDSDSTSSSGTSSSAGPNVEDKTVQTPVDYLNTQYKLNFRQAAQSAKTAAENGTQEKKGAGELTQDEEQL